MANKEHLAKLKEALEIEDITIWNEWRNKNYYINIDLSGVDLSYADLHGAHLHEAHLIGANLFGANLQWADLSGAHLIGARLHEAHLHGAHLHGAHLHGADLQWADLQRADLQRADLIGADLQWADLQRADLHGACLLDANLTKSKLEEVDFENCIIGETVFGLTDLGSCKNLETVEVRSPCIIDFQTLQASKNLPKEFLFKIGLPEIYIDYLPAFFDQTPIRMYSTFLSHSSANKDFANKLYNALIKHKVQVWYDEKKIKPGDFIMDKIDKGINVYDKMILVCSKQSLSEESSWWVEEEIERILKKERAYRKTHKEKISLLIPITIDDYILQMKGEYGDTIHRRNIGDFRAWNDDTHFEKALEDLIHVLNVDRPDRDPLPKL